MKIYVSVGTHEQAFQRLLDGVKAEIVRTQDEWLVQYGVGSWTLELDNVRSVRYLTASEVESALSWADVMVSQSSPGNAFGALNSGVWPILIGRRKCFGEHVDDHQVRFATALSEMGLATEMLEIDELSAVLESERSHDPDFRRETIVSVNKASKIRQREFRRQVWPLILGTSH